MFDTISNQRTYVIDRNRRMTLEKGTRCVSARSDLGGMRSTLGQRHARIFYMDELAKYCVALWERTYNQELEWDVAVFNYWHTTCEIGLELRVDPL